METNEQKRSCQLTASLSLHVDLNLEKTCLNSRLK